MKGYGKGGLLVVGCWVALLLLSLSLSPEDSSSCSFSPSTPHSLLLILSLTALVCPSVLVRFFFLIMSFSCSSSLLLFFFFFCFSLFCSSFLVSVSSSPPSPFSFNLSGSPSFSSSSSPPIIQTVFTPSLPSFFVPVFLSFSSNCSSVLCVQSSPLSAPSDFNQWDNNCKGGKMQIQQQQTTQEQTVHIESDTLPIGVASVSVFVSSPPLPVPSSCLWSFTVSGSACPLNFYPSPTDFNNCIEPLYIDSSATSPVNITLSSSASLISSRASSQYSSAIVLKLSALEPSNNSISIYSNAGTAPVFNYSSSPPTPLIYLNRTIFSSSSSELSNLVPSISSAQIFSLSSINALPEPGTFSASVDEYICPPPLFGVYCSVSVSNLIFSGVSRSVELSATSFALSPNQQYAYAYFQLLFTSPLIKSFSLGVKSLSSSDDARTPALLLRRGNIPTDSLYDLLLTSSSSSTASPDSHATLLIQSGLLDSLADDVFYVALRYPSDAESIRVGLFWSGPSSCPNNCTGARNQGVCEEKTGVCICDKDWRDGYDCSISTRDDSLLPNSAKIVLVVFSTVGSVLLGVFLCWFFRRDWFREEPSMPGAGNQLGQGERGQRGGNPPSGAPQAYNSL